MFKPTPRLFPAIGLALCASIVPFALAQEPVAPPAVGLDRELTFKTGTVTIGNDEVTVQVPEGFTYLEAADARFVVEDLWGNPPNPSTLGMFVPGGEQELLAGSYAVIVRMDRDGFTDDSDASEIDFDDLLSQMKADTEAGNAERKRRNYSTVELLGWAEAPHYDAAAKKLYWAKRLRFEGAPVETLNYDVRVLGRKGKLVYSAVAEDGQLQEVAEGCKKLLAATEFTAGNRYEDFDSNFDKVAAGGIGALVAGKVLAKVGFFALIAKFWKLIALAVIGLGALAKKLFTRAPAT